MKDKLILGGVVVGAVGLVLTVWWNWRSPNNDNFPEGVDYICLNQSCAHTWNLSMKELGEHHEAHYGQPVPCPKCGESKTFRAEKCPHCGKVIQMQRGGGNCPHCKASLAPGPPPR